MKSHHEVQNLIVESKRISERDRNLLEHAITQLSAGKKVSNPSLIKNILNSNHFLIAKVSVPADKSWGDKNEFASEIAQLNGAVSPFTFLTDGGIKGKVKSKGKRSVLIDMVVDNLNNLSSLRGRDIYFLLEKKDSSHQYIENELPMVVKQKKDLLAALLDKDKMRQVKLLGSILDQCYPRMHGLHWLNPLSYVDWIFSRIAMRAERVLYTIGAIFSFPFHETRKKMNNSTGLVKAGWFCATTLAAIPHMIGQIPNVAGNVLRYTRHLVSGVSNLVTSCAAKIKDKITGSQDYGKKYPTLTQNLKAIGKSILYLIPSAAVVAICLVPGMQFVPALVPVVAKLSLGSAVFSWLGMSAGVSIAAQSISGGLRSAVIAGRKDPELSYEASGSSARAKVGGGSEAKIGQRIGKRNDTIPAHTSTLPQTSSVPKAVAPRFAPIVSDKKPTEPKPPTFPSFTATRF